MAVFDIQIRTGAASELPRDQVMIATIGSWSALAAGVAILAYGVVQIAQVAGLVTAPLDAILIYATSLAIAPPFLVALLALHYSVAAERRFFSHGALSFAVIYATFALLVYVVQLGLVIPASLRGEASAVLDVTPHSLFWTIDALAYLAMGVATLFGAAAFGGGYRDKTARWFFFANALITPFVGLVYFYPTFSVPLLFLASPWLVTAAGSMLALAAWFRR